MSFATLLIKRCSWRRRTHTSDDVYGSPQYTDTIMGSDVPCRYEEIEGHHLWEAEPGGDFNRSKWLLFLEPTDIMPNDKVTIDGSDNFLVQDDEKVYDSTSNVHHIEVRMEKTKDL